MTVAYVVALVTLIMCAWVTLSTLQEVVETQDAVRHTYQVIGEVEKMYSDLMEAESNLRGYVVNQRPDFLARHREKIEDVKGAIVTLRGLTADNPSQQTRCDTMQNLLDDRIASFQKVIQVRQQKGLLYVANNVSGGSVITDKIRAVRDELGAEERRLLERRLRASRASVANATLANSISGIAGLALLTGLFLISRRFFRILLDARDLEIHHREELEVEIQKTERARAELERSNRELQDFAFVASHDLQEPLRKIRAFGDRVMTRNSEILDATSIRDLGRMQNAAERMQGLINDLLALSRVTTRGQPFAKVDLNRVLAEVKDDLESRIASTGAEVKGVNLPTLTADPTQMRQLLQNLIGNAIKFRKEAVKPQVTVRALEAPRPGMVAFEVQDNGIGFDPRHADKIFTIFQRLHGQGEYEGSGIGLAICRRIVERHGGVITTRSTPGEGATFSIVLPITPPTENPR